MSAAVLEEVAATAGVAATELMRAVGLVVYMAAGHSVVAGCYFVPVPSMAGYGRQLAALVVHHLALGNYYDKFSRLHSVSH